MIDEAYTHIAGAPFSTDLVVADKDVVVLRTFSKIYGMAGMRAGAAIGSAGSDREDGRIRCGNDADHRHGCRKRQPAAKDSDADRRKIIGDVREDTFNYLEQNKFSVCAFGLQLLHGGRQAARR